MVQAQGSNPPQNEGEGKYWIAKNLVPEKGECLRPYMRKLADYSVRSSWGEVHKWFLATRVMGIILPILAAGHALYHGACVGATLLTLPSLILNPSWVKFDTIKQELKENALSTLKCLAATVVTTVIGVGGLFIGSYAYRWLDVEDEGQPLPAQQPSQPRPQPPILQPSILVPSSPQLDEPLNHSVHADNGANENQHKNIQKINSFTSIKSELSHSVDNLKDELEQKKKDIQDLENKKNEAKHLEEEIQKAKDQLEDLKNQIASQNINNKNIHQDSLNLQDEISKAKGQILILGQEAIDKVEEVENLKNQLKTINNDLKAKSDKIKELEVKNASSQQVIDECQAANEQLMMESSHAEDQLMRLNTQLSKAQSELQDLQKKCDLEKTHSDELKKDKTKLEGEISKLQNDLEIATTAIKDKQKISEEISDLKQKIEVGEARSLHAAENLKLAEENFKLEQEKNEVLSKKNQQEKDLNRQLAENQQKLEEQLAGYAQKNQELNSRLETLNAELLEVKKQIEQKKNQIDQLQKTQAENAHSKDKDLEVSHKQLEVLQATQTKLNEALNLEKNNAAKLADENKALQQKLALLTLSHPAPKLQNTQLKENAEIVKNWAQPEVQKDLPLGLRVQNNQLTVDDDGSVTHDALSMLKELIESAKANISLNMESRDKKVEKEKAANRLALADGILTFFDPSNLSRYKSIKNGLDEKDLALFEEILNSATELQAQAGADLLKLHAEEQEVQIPGAGIDLDQAHAKLQDNLNLIKSWKDTPSGLELLENGMLRATISNKVSKEALSTLSYCLAELKESCYQLVKEVPAAQFANPINPDSQEFEGFHILHANHSEAFVGSQVFYMIPEVSIDDIKSKQFELKKVIDSINNFSNQHDGEPGIALIKKQCEDCNILAAKEPATLKSDLEQMIQTGNHAQISQQLIQKLLKGEKNLEQEYGYLAKNAVQAELKRLYGGIVDEVLSSYDFNTSTHFSVLEIKAILADIMANMTMKDLEFCYKQQGKNPTFDMLKEEELIDFLEKMRPKDFLESLMPLPIQADDPTEYMDFPVDERLDPRFKHKPYAALLLRNVSFLHACARAADYDPSVAHAVESMKEMKSDFGYAEYLTRQVAYGAFIRDVAKTRFSEGSLFALYDPYNGGKRSLKQIMSHYQGPGIGAIHVLPTERSEEKSRLYTVFRGTDDKNSLCRDFLEPKFKFQLKLFSFNPGDKTFDEETKKVMKESIAAAIAKMKQLQGSNQVPIHYEVSGHSLGSSDAERTLALIAEMLASGEINESNLTSLILNCWNAPGVAQETRVKFLEDVDKIFKKSNLAIELNYFKVDHDFIQRTGGDYLGSKSNSKPELKLHPNVKTSVFIYNQRPFSYSAPLYAHKHAILPNIRKNTLRDLRSNNAMHLKKYVNRDLNESEVEYASQALNVNWLFATSPRK